MRPMGIKHANLYIIGFPEGEQRERQQNKTIFISFKEIVGGPWCYSG